MGLHHFSTLRRPPRAALKDACRFGGHPLGFHHRGTSRYPHLAALVHPHFAAMTHILRFQGHPLARHHSRTPRRPPSAAPAQVFSFQGQSLALYNSSTTKCPHFRRHNTRSCIPSTALGLRPLKSLTGSLRGRPDAYNRSQVHPQSFAHVKREADCTAIQMAVSEGRSPHAVLQLSKPQRRRVSLRHWRIV